MVKPIDPARAVDYIHPTDREGGTPDGAPRADATAFRVRALTKRQRAELLDAMGGTASGANIGSSRHQTVRWGLAGVEHYDIAFTTEDDKSAVGGKAPTEAFLDTIPDEVFRDLAAKIQSLSKLTEDDAGKSSRPST